jgi:hypothetical protein
VCACVCVCMCVCVHVCVCVCVCVCVQVHDWAPQMAVYGGSDDSGLTVFWSWVATAGLVIPLLMISGDKSPVAALRP